MTKLSIVEDGKLVEYERTGRCNGCGECCGEKNTITYTVSVASGRLSLRPDKYEKYGSPEGWEEWEGYSIFWSQGLWWYFKVTDVKDREVPAPCSQQDPDTKLCSLWKLDDWPAICRYWPFKSSDLEPFPKCGFSFQKVSKEV